jgi:hypothetical protein
MSQTTLLLSSSAAQFILRNEGHSSGFYSLLNRPHPPSPSPKDRERKFKSLVNFLFYHINSVSLLYTYQLLLLLSKRLNKLGLCSDGLLREEKVGMRLLYSAINHSVL